MTRGAPTLPRRYRSAHFDTKVEALRYEDAAEVAKWLNQLEQRYVIQPTFGGEEVFLVGDVELAPGTWLVCHDDGARWEAYGERLFDQLFTAA